jgi:subtilisin family serine protease
MLGVVALVAAPLSVAAPAWGASGSTPDETLVVQFDPGANHAAALVGSLGALHASSAPRRRYVLRVKAAQAASVLRRLRSDPTVRYAEIPEPVHATDTTPNDPCYSGSAQCTAYDQNGVLVVPPPAEAYLQTIGAPAAWDISKGDGVRIAIIDSGVDATHEDLADKINSQTNICIADDPNCSGTGDSFGHGTHVSGIAAADDDNGKGVSSLGWNVRLDEYKVLDSQGSGSPADVATAIYDAAANGDRVINLSLANYSCQADPADCGPDPDEQTAVEYAISHNVVVVAAAGNDGYDSPTFPASYPGVLSVAATDTTGVVQPYSQWGSAADIAAPGGVAPGDGPAQDEIVSTWPGNTYRVDAGTSMAAPQVAAAAALLISHNPSLSGPQISQILESTARPTSGGNPISGGVLNVPAALAAESNPPHLYNGYEMAGADGSVYSFGSVGYFGQAAPARLAKPVVGMALAANGLGYWLDASDGGVFSYGDAPFYGSTGNIRLNQPVVGMAATADSRGYWLVASDGGIFTFGDAPFYGSTGNVRLNKPIVGMAATPDGRGYWLVASDGGMFTFGDAGFYGSTGNVRLNKPIVGMAATPDGRGYWLVASDGGVFSFGDAHFHGSTGNVKLVQPVVAMASTPSGNGYWLVAADGGIFSFGAPFYGSLGGETIPAPIVGAQS